MRGIASLVLLSLIAPSAARAQAPVEIVMSEWAPFSFTENGIYKGSDVEIIDAIFQEMNAPRKLTVYPWNRCVKMMEERKADMVITLSKTAEREAFLLFPAEPINISQNVIFVKKSSKVKFASYEDLKGLTIGISAGYTYGDEFDKSPLFKREEAQNEEINFKKLQAGRIDGFVCDKIVGVYMTKKLSMAKDITYLPKTVSEFKMYAAFAKKPGAAELAAKYDQALRAIKKSGAYQKLLDAYTK